MAGDAWRLYRRLKGAAWSNVTVWESSCNTRNHPTKWDISEKEELNVWFQHVS
jgi:hypothetical protein